MRSPLNPALRTAGCQTRCSKLWICNGVPSGEANTNAPRSLGDCVAEPSVHAERAGDEPGHDDRSIARRRFERGELGLVGAELVLHCDAPLQHVDVGPPQPGEFAEAKSAVRADQHERAVARVDRAGQAFDLRLREEPHRDL